MASTGLSSAARASVSAMDMPLTWFWMASKLASMATVEPALAMFSL